MRLAGRFTSSRPSRKSSEQMDYESDFQEGYTDSSLGKIYYRRHRADGAKFIFIHGLGGTTKVWAKLVGYIPGEFDVSLIDLLGHGKSAVPEDINYTISEQVQILQEFIADQNNGSSFIVGHSYGAWVAAYYASYPYPASGFVLADSAGMQELDEREKEEFLRKLLMANNKEYVMRSILNSPKEEMLSRDILSKIKKPTLIIWGSSDTTVDPKYASTLREGIKGSKLIIIDGAGHNPHYTSPERFAQAILEFVNSM